MVPVEVLPGPAPVLLSRPPAGPPPRLGRVHAAVRLLEPGGALFRREVAPGQEPVPPLRRGGATLPHDATAAASPPGAGSLGAGTHTHHHRPPGQLLPEDPVPGADAVPAGEGLRDGDLQLAGDLGHVLTVARIPSLSSPRWTPGRAAVRSRLRPRRPP